MAATTGRDVLTHGPAIPVVVSTAPGPGRRRARPFADGAVLAGAYQVVGAQAQLDAGHEYRARDLVLQREVQIIAGAAGLLGRARLLARLAHDNLARVYDTRAHDGLDFVVVEAIEGPSLREYVALRGGPHRLDPAEVVFVLAAIADALAALHRAGMIHGALAAEAVVITPERRVVLTRLGGALLAGTQLQPEEGVKRDLFALGTLAYELLIGEDQTGSVGSALEARRVAPALGRLVRGLLQGRHADASDLAHELRCLHQGTALGPGRDVVIAHRDRKVARAVGDALCRFAPGCTIRIVTTGPAVLEAVAAAEPAVLILDLDLPELNGIEVCMALPGAGQRASLRVCVTCAAPGAHRAVLDRLGVAHVVEPAALEDPATVGALLALPLLDGAAPSTTIGGRYVLGRRLGAGGMGQVFEARHVLLNKRVALKLLSPDLARDPRARGRFLQEAQLASTLSHPNITQVVDYGRDPSMGPYLVMELLDGRPLSDLAGEPLTLRTACDLLGQVASALETLHQDGILHGDVKAENILVVEDTSERRRRIAKLLDFGLASRGTPLADGERFAGTPEYFAPERVHGADPSIQTDLYALGVVGYLLLTGSVPFVGDTRAVLAAQVSTPVPPPVRPDGTPIDPALEQLLMRALAKDPKARHPTLAAFRYELATASHMLGLGPRRSRPSRIRAESAPLDPDRADADSDGEGRPSPDPDPSAGA